eukprot:TRINITY_DN33931_c0_g1_i1.p1 TRINITY_DN33931_c0_g1~~TRINITY_DN33931_c0_g1_i1.p1  ORF type:complete len:101 (+),score=4.06 TRINITY_DN33931_c0_g1_i1:162-464(+)
MDRRQAEIAENLDREARRDPEGEKHDEGLRPAIQRIQHDHTGQHHKGGEIARVGGEGVKIIATGPRDNHEGHEKNRCGRFPQRTGRRQRPTRADYRSLER